MVALRYVERVWIVMVPVGKLTVVVTVPVSVVAETA